MLLHNLLTTHPEFQKVEIFGVPALFFDGRLSCKLSDGLYRYDLRGSDYDPGCPIAVERNVVVNHTGTIVTAEPLDLGKDGRLYFNDDEGLNYA